MRTLPCLVLLMTVGACAPGTQEPPIRYLPSPATPGSIAPNLASGPGGPTVMSWIEPDGDGHALKFAVLGENGWTATRTVSRGDNWFVNWADFPSVVPLGESFWAAHWLVRQPAGGYAYDVFMSRSLDGGETWSPPRKPYDDDSPTEHGFVTLFPHAGGFGAVWLDGRKMINEGSADIEDSGMTLRGALLDQNLERSSMQEIDGLTCDCCPTDVALTEPGAVAVYRDRTTDEIRDISVSRFVNGEWTPGYPIASDNWHMPACPVNGPVVDANGNDVVVAWFTAADELARVQMARSADAGASFSAPVEITSGKVYGRVGAVLLENGDAVVSWLADGGDRQAAFYAVLINREGQAGPVIDISQCEDVAPMTTPQLKKTGGDIVAAWTVVHDGTTLVRSAVIPGELLLVSDEPLANVGGQSSCSSGRTSESRSSSASGISPTM